MPAEATQPGACLIVIGNEILSGRTQDVNLAYIGHRCDELGVPLLEARVVPDQEAEIIAAVEHCRRRYTYVFTTGGIGPTHDDITSASIARAFGVALERNPEAEARLRRSYGDRTPNGAALRMADIPAGASLIDNPISGAPGFCLENVYVLAGVPVIMQAMFEGLAPELNGGAPITSRTIDTLLSESRIAAGLAALQAEYPEVSIGSYPYLRHGRPAGRLVLRGSDPALLERVEAELRQRLADLKP